MQKSITLLFAGAIAFAGSSLYAQKGDAAKGKEVFEAMQRLPQLGQH